MTGNKDSKAGQGKYEFIEEKIVPKRKNKLKKLLISVGMTVALAIIFGLVSRVVFCLSEHCINEAFGEEDDKKIISFTTPSPQPVATPKVEATKEPEQTDDKEEVIEKTVEETLKDYTKMYSLLTEVAKEFNKSVVTVSSVISGVDWFDNPLEQSDASYGVVIANNGEELLILTSKNKIEDASSMRVTFSDNVTVDARLYGYDTDTGIAVLAVEIEDIPGYTLSEVTVAILGDTYYLPMGSPILALGSPNGYVYSMEFGTVTNEMMETYITDSKLEFFNTDIHNNIEGEGVIVNLNGQVVGIITHEFNTGVNENINTVLGITRLKTIIEKLVNRSERIYFGIVGNDMPTKYSDKMNILGGVYVTEVVTNSPAFKAGIKSGDIIMKINENSIPSMNIFAGIIATYTPKDVVDVTLLRTTKEKSNEITLQVTLEKKD